MAARKINVAIYVEIPDGTEEEAAQEMAQGFGIFGPVLSVLQSWPAGEVLGADVVNIEEMTDQEKDSYIEEDIA